MNDLPRLFAYYLYDIEKPKKEIAHMTAEKNANPWASLPRGSVVILQAVVGSSVHGTSVEGTDDRDEMAICIEPPEKVLGLSHFETMVYRTQPEGVRSGPGGLDLVVHTLRKFARLAARGNPTILLPLFAPSSHVLWSNGIGRRLVEQRSMFVSKAAGRAFLGYLIAQKERLMGDRGQMRVTRPELVEQYGFDTKYAGHVIRLGWQGVELMEWGKITLPMPKYQRDYVVGVRTGRYSFNQVLQMAGDLEHNLRAAIDTTVLPDKADDAKIDEFCVSAYLDTWRQHGALYRG
jgi:hypothetical protein